MGNQKHNAPWPNGNYRPLPETCPQSRLLDDGSFDPERVQERRAYAKKWWKATPERFTLCEVAKAMDVTPERVRQLIKKHDLRK